MTAPARLTNAGTRCDLRIHGRRCVALRWTRCRIGVGLVRHRDRTLRQPTGIILRIRHVVALARRDRGRTVRARIGNMFPNRLVGRRGNRQRRGLATADQSSLACTQPVEHRLVERRPGSGTCQFKQKRHKLPTFGGRQRLEIDPGCDQIPDIGVSPLPLSGPRTMDLPQTGTGASARCRCSPSRRGSANTSVCTSSASSTMITSLWPDEPCAVSSSRTAAPNRRR